MNYKYENEVKPKIMTAPEFSKTGNKFSISSRRLCLRRDIRFLVFEKLPNVRLQIHS